MRDDPLAIAVVGALQLSGPLTYAKLAPAIYARPCKEVEAIMATLGVSTARLQPVGGALSVE